MKIAEVKFTEWDGPSYAECDSDDDGNTYERGEYIVIERENVLDMAKLINIVDYSEKVLKGKLIEGKVLRRINNEDIANIEKNAGEKKEVLEYCQKFIEQLGLDMKLIDAIFSLDGERVKIVFTAEGRVDFRDLVKMLGRYLKKNIRMHQIGIRDEAKIMGALGICGRELCCRKFLKELTSITSDLADLQQVSHRGADRISGVCGRLMCCLNFEKNGYEDLIKRLPEIGGKVKITNKEGVVIGRHILKQVVDVKLEDGSVIEVEAEKIEH